MFKYPISNRDLLRNVMARVPAANVVYNDPQVQKFAADSLKGLCSFTIVRGPEVKESKTVYYPDGTAKEHVTTTQHHHLEIHYYNPEDEFEVKLSI